MMTLSLTAAQIALFNAQLQTMVSSVSSLVSLMGSWNQQIGYLGLVSAPSTPGYFAAQVTDAQTSWSNLVTTLNWYLGIIAASGMFSAAQT